MNRAQELDNLPEVSGAEREALEAVLRRALCPVDVPSGFADTVLQRANALDATAPPEAHGRGIRLLAHKERSPRQHRSLGKLLRWPGEHVQAWGAGALAAAALALAILAGEQNHLKREHERELAERHTAANQQFEAAVRITDQTLEQIQEQIQARTREHLRRVGAPSIE